MTNETWLPIKSYPNYEVSDWGVVRNKHGRIISTHLSNTGYNRNQLWRNDSHKDIYTHRLVALAFIPNPDCKPEVNHIDCVKTNNHVSNLEWVTKSENRLHSYANELQSKQGSKHHMTKLTEADIITIRTLLECGERGDSVAKRFGVSQSAISQIKSRTTWTHVA